MKDTGAQDYAYGETSYYIAFIITQALNCQLECSTVSQEHKYVKIWWGKSLHYCIIIAFIK